MVTKNFVILNTVVSFSCSQPQNYEHMQRNNAARAITKNDYYNSPILLMSSGPRTYPDSDRECIPEWFSPVATLLQCTHDGRSYYDEHNDFKLEIPEGAIPEGESITIDIGVALYGPFQYPEGLRPVSPVFWVCVRDCKRFQFLKPVKVTIQHCLNLKNPEDIESLGLTFLKGDHKMNSQQMHRFQQAEGDAFFSALDMFGVFQLSHFCSLCISCKDANHFIHKALFCISAVIPRIISFDQPSYAYFFITFLLSTCLDKVKEQISNIPELQGHKEEKQKFQFSKDEENQALEIILPQALPDNWMVGLQFSKKV